MNVVQNMVVMQSLIEAIKAHPLCLKLEDDGVRFRVIYPSGFYPDGVQASYSNGKAVALQRMIDAMERHWGANSIHGVAA